ncbi:hypothetical protein [Anaerosacchariphilus polymeriproducens]|uniref:Uncharacterized protein n=1 Tax=Anaerosacchariphilus polymeriproducens TaxID=1812858 RepID=A0A371ATG6_9FIRM|nr:hypothetical protein [Anaerosacchariphilus polymeriproducens]RDU22770.1 hypothetical protein DWV06_13455 [Anaerosacchariphilus polymeriproducens]
MSRPSKPYAVISSENKAHRTKRELKQREEGEKALISGVALKEHDNVKKNLIAHKEFKRLSDIFKRIEKNDAVYEGVINRYCLIFAECMEFEEKREKFYQQICDFEENSGAAMEKGELTQGEYYKIQMQMQKTLIDIDKQVQTKRKMLLDIEKENVMTIAAALRSIPKKEEPKNNALLKALNDG